MAQQGIFDMACWATGVTMRPESCIVGDCCFRSRDLLFKLRSSCLLYASCARERCWDPSSHGLRGLGGPHFEELPNELFARARMLRLQLGSRLVSAPLTFGVPYRTLSGEERCGRMIANPVKLTCTSTTPLLWTARVPMRAHNRCTA